MSRKWDKYKRAEEAIFTKHGVSKAEAVVLDKVRLKIPLPPVELSRFIVGYLESFPEYRFTAEQCENAIHSLVDKGLLHVLAFADAVSPAPPYSTWDDDEIDGLEGKLDFTPAGYALMKEVSAVYEAFNGSPLLRPRASQ